MSEKERKNQEAMNDLLSGLTGTPVTPSQEAQQLPDNDSPAPAKKAARRGRRPRSEEYQTAYIVVRKDLYEKIKVIAEKTGCNIKDVVERSFDKSVKAFENKFGVIHVPRKNKIDLETAFDE